MIKLTDEEKTILHTIELHAEMPMKALEESTGIADHKIRYAIEKWKRNGLIRKMAFIDVYPLGYTDYAIYFSLRGSACEQDALINDIIAHEQSSWLGEVGGAYHFALALYAKDIHDVQDFLQNISTKHPNIIKDKAIHIRSNFTHFAADYQDPPQNTEPRPSMRFGKQQQTQIDDNDWALLSLLGNNEWQHDQGLARQLGWPLSTLRYRKKQLEEKQIINGYGYQINRALLGRNLFHLLIFSRGLSTQLRDTLLAYTQEESRIIHFVEGIGKWDLELSLDVATSQEARDIVSTLYARFSDQIHEVNTLPMFSYKKWSWFPFHKKQAT